jgi:hypothetical protein
MSLVDRVPSDTSSVDLKASRILLNTQIAIVDKVPEEVYTNQELLEENARLLSQKVKDPAMLKKLDANLTLIRDNFKTCSDKARKL